ncbi:adenylyl-sulfate kinase [Candidatus Omnitrophota bacterium]
MSNDALPVGTILITGISASGKTTLGKRLEKDLINSGIRNVKRIDGEDVRRQLEKQGICYGYSEAERKILGPKVAHMALEENKKGFVCILCGIYHIRSTRQEMRTMINNLMEVYLNCSVDICAQRDSKGHYAKAFQGLCENFIGVTEPYQKSENVNLVLDTGKNSIDECSRILLESTMVFLKGRAVKAETGSRAEVEG